MNKTHRKESFWQNIPYFHLNKHSFRPRKLTLLLLIICTSGLLPSNVHAQTDTASVAINNTDTTAIAAKVKAPTNKVNISTKNTDITTVMAEIEAQTDYLFVYSSSEVNLDYKVSLSATEQTVAEVLNSLFKNSGVTYVIEGTNIMLMKKSIPTVRASTDNKRRNISGTIVDEEGIPLIGVAVLIKGTVVGVTTNDVGEYSLNYSEQNAVVELIYMGYKTMEKAIGESTILNFTMEFDAVAMDELVVVASGTQRKESVIGAITTIKMDNLKVPVGQISTSLGGQLAGVVTVQSSGEPGSGAEFYIRGIATFGANKSPLVLVDGIERELDLVDVEDISSFSILKDASATAIYGVRGANGVMLINTKKGAKGRPNVSFKYEQGISSPIQMVELVDSYDFANLYNETIGYNHYTEKHLDQYRMANNAEGRDINLYPNVDWVDELFEPLAHNRRINASISGGGDIARYYVSGGYYNEGSIFKESNLSNYSSSINYNKINFRANIDIDVTPTTEVGVKMSNVFEVKNEPGGGTSSVWDYAYITSPNAYPTYFTDTKGDWSAWSGPNAGAGFNPYNVLVNSGYKESFENSTQASISLNQTFGDLVPGLSIKVNYAWDAWNYKIATRKKEVQQFNALGRDVNGELILSEVAKGSNTLGYETSVGGKDNNDFKKNGTSNYLEAAINYSRVFGKNHNFSALFLYNQKILEYVGIAGDLTTGQAKYLSLPYKNQGLAGRVTYDYDSRYFAEVNVGYNGSENFSPGNRFGLFPAIAVGWVVSNEKFLKSNKVLSLLKLRASYGKVGNDRISDGRRYIYNATIIEGGDSYSGMGLNGGYNPGIIAIGEVANPNVGWEESIKTNVGIELGFLRNALKFTADYFHEKRDGIFMERAALPHISGITTTPWINVGEMENQGFELNLEYFQQIGQVTLSARGNYSFARNTLLNNDEPDYMYKYQNKINQTYNQPFGLISEGLFKDQADIDASPTQSFGTVRPGDIKYRDVNGDGKVDANDKIAIGYPGLPEIIYGFGLTAYWKGLSASVFFQGIDNSNIFLSGRAVKPFEAGNHQQSSFHNDIIDGIWRESNSDVNARYPRASVTANGNNSQTSDYWMRDRAYLRLKNAEIAYEFPTKLLSKIRLQKIKVYVQGVNLLTFSNFKLWDPENGGGQGNAYPLNRTINFGIQIIY